MRHKRPLGIVVATTILLLIPLIVMQFTDEVNWKLSDFVVGGALLLGAGFVLDLLLRKVKNVGYRIVLSLGILVLLILVWAELAVGIFGTPISGS